MLITTQQQTITKEPKMTANNNTAKKSRRFFTDDFKRELVYKIKSGQMTMSAVSKQYSILEALLERWTKKFGNTQLIPHFGPAVTPQVAIDTETQLKLRLLDEILEKERLQRIVSGIKPSRQELPQIEVSRDSHSHA